MKFHSTIYTVDYNSGEFNLVNILKRGDNDKYQIINMTESIIYPESYDSINGALEHLSTLDNVKSVKKL